jgi:hypothetical protein
MIPKAILEKRRERAQEIMRQGRPVNRKAAVMIIVIWLFFAVLGILFMVRLIKK